MRQTINLQLEIISFAIYTSRTENKNAIQRSIEREFLCALRVSSADALVCTSGRGTMIGRDIQKHAKLIGDITPKSLRGKRRRSSVRHTSNRYASQCVLKLGARYCRSLAVVSTRSLPMQSFRQCIKSHRVERYGFASISSLGCE
jgi:hypothetical protein